MTFNSIQIVSSSHIYIYKHNNAHLSCCIIERFAQNEHKCNSCLSNTIGCIPKFKKHHPLHLNLCACSCVCVCSCTFVCRYKSLQTQSQAMKGISCAHQSLTALQAPPCLLLLLRLSSQPSCIDFCVHKLYLYLNIYKSRFLDSSVLHI